MPQIATNVLRILGAAVVEGSKVSLVGQLDRKLYVEADKVLQAAGGKWNRSAKAHIFEGDAAEALEPILLTGEYSRTKQDFGQFDTPQPLACDVVERAGIRPQMRVLEPSAGLGNIAVEAIAAGGCVHTIEIDAARCARLALRVAGLDSMPAASLCSGQQADFLDIQPDASYDRVVMNPPFAGQDDIRHVMHAFGFLKPNGRLVAIMSAGVLFRTNKLTAVFRDLVADNGGAIEPLPEGSFRSSGTTVNTCIVTLTAGDGYA
ncbi:N-6 DNA methylase [Shinella zoogloeoides]|uniref:N-6 DNA methylase n=1 Tax=Shinella zoogloeoides TaxID=352475 RepID=UPI0028B0424D|nr:N-6 DNA methylase [Shinella zoogloeoides]